MNISDKLNVEFNDIDEKKPDNNTVVIGYCEPPNKSDFEAEVLFKDNKFYFNGKEVRCFYWKPLSSVANKE